MVKNTSSENIYVWKQPKDNVKKKNQKSVNSVSVSDVNKALSIHKNDNASMYFGASLEFDKLYMKHLSYQMGHNFGGYFPAGNNIQALDQQGEIETFVSRAGNHTSWHTDFQENFTL